jgi:hypothetical protein
LLLPINSVIGIKAAESVPEAVDSGIDRHVKRAEAPINRGKLQRFLCRRRCKHRYTAVNEPNRKTQQIKQRYEAKEIYGLPEVPKESVQYSVPVELIEAHVAIRIL